MEEDEDIQTNKLNTEDFCFLCLKVLSFKTEANNSFNDVEREQINENGTSVSLKGLLRYLQITNDLIFRKFSTATTTAANSLSSLLNRRNEYEAELCPFCANLVNRFSDSFCTLEIIQMEVNYWLEIIQKEISDTLNTGANQFNDEAQDALVNCLRKEIVKKSSRKLKSGSQLKVQLERIRQISPIFEDSGDDDHHNSSDNETEGNEDTSSQDLSSPSTETMNDEQISAEEMYRRNPKTKTFDCVKCQLSSRSSYDVRRHYQTVHLKKRYNCELCGAPYSNPSYVKLHMKTCTGKIIRNPRGSKCVLNKDTRKFSCMECKKEFTSHASAYTHYEKVHVKKEYKCDLCDCKIVFKLEAYLKNHQTSVHCRSSAAKRSAKMNGSKCKVKKKREQQRKPTRKRQFCCKICNVKFFTNIALKNHKTIVHLGKSLKCKRCKKEFNHGKYFRNHELTCQKQIERKQVRLNFKEKNKKFPSVSRGTQSSTPSKKQHQGVMNQLDSNANASSPSASAPPPQTGNVTKEFVTETIEMWIKNWETGTYDCSYCGKKYGESGRVLRHYQTAHLGKKCICNLCGGYYACKVSLARHKKTCKGTPFIQMWLKNSETGSYDCAEPSCKKTYNNSGSARTHYLTSHLNKRYKCELCGVAYFTKSSKIRHQESCNGEKPIRESKYVFNPKTKKFCCTKCNKELTSRCGARVHYDATHTKKEFKCEICNIAKYFLPERLKRHQKTCLRNLKKSSEEKRRRERDPRFKFRCRICRKKFKQRGNMEIHQKLVHTKERNFECDVCQQKFKQKWVMEQHKEVIHFGRRLQCKKCNKDFAYKYQLRQHRPTCERKLLNYNKS